MLRLTHLPLLAAALGALAVPAGASAADCTLRSPAAGTGHAIPGTRLVARDPYSGMLSRNRLFFDFSVRGPAADLGAVAKVQWSMDGTVVREDPKAPFEWKGQSGSSTRMPAGDHQITVTMTPKAGDAASVSFPLTATDCQTVAFTAEVPRRSGPATLSWQSALESYDGEPLTSVSATATRNVAVALPARRRGKAIGTLKVTGASAGQTKTYTLKGAPTALSRGALKVRLVPGAKGFLKVTGLPAGTQAVSVRLASGVVHLRAPKAPFALTGGLTAASGSASASVGGVYV
jgi:hypothetical protein